MKNLSVPVPDLGEAQNVELIELCVAVGDKVEEGQSLAVLESEKASMEVPSPAAGEVRKLLLAEGEEIRAGDVLLQLQTSQAIEQESTQESTQETTQETVPQPPREAARQTAERPVPGVGQNNNAREAPSVAISGSPALLPVPVPDLGETQNVELIELCVAVGDKVEEGQSLAVLESEKASMEMPSPAAGEVRELLLEEGAEIQAGDVLLHLQTAASSPEAIQKIPQEIPQENPQEVRQDAGAPQPLREAARQTAERPATGAGQNNNAGAASVHAGPAVRKLAREFGIDLSRVSASGARGRIIKEDLHLYVRDSLNRPPEQRAQQGQSALPTLPDIDFSAFGGVRTEQMHKLHRAVASNMLRSWLNVPHVTQFDEVDVTALEKLRKELQPEAQRRGLKLTLLPFLLCAAAKALRKHPGVNASLHGDGRHMIYKDYVHVGIAVDTPAGLLVPVIRDVDQKNIWTMSEEVARLVQSARDRKLSPKDLQGGCFTVSSLGAIGGIGFTPVVNAPEAAILGVARMERKPWVVDDALAIRKILPLSLSYDHRVLNGAAAGRFFADLTAGLLAPDSLVE